jgi:hypothetical protein
VYIPLVYYRTRYTHQLAKLAYTRCAIACSPICCYGPNNNDSLSLRCHHRAIASGCFRGLRERGVHSLASCIETRMRRNTCIARVYTSTLHARTFGTLALAMRRSGGRKLTETGKLALRNGASRRYRARNRSPVHDRSRQRGREGSKQPSARDIPAETITYTARCAAPPPPRRACKLHRT